MARTRIREGQAVDADFVSESELASAVGTSGADLTGVKDTGGYYSTATVEEVLQELGITKSTVDSFEATSGGSIVLKRSDSDVFDENIIGKIDFHAKDAVAQGELSTTWDKL